MELKIYENMLTIAAMQTLRVSCDLPLLDSGMIKTAIARSLLNLTAVVDDQVVGMLRVAGDGIFVFVICDVMVHPEYRNRGIASAMVMYALQCIENMLPSGVLGTVSLFAAKEHVKLYKRLGFEALPQKDRGPGMQTIVIGRQGDGSIV
ncbi:MAG: GNAT family N-acetyltransferase [Eubacteriales bacterium]